MTLFKSAYFGDMGCLCDNEDNDKKTTSAYLLFTLSNEHNLDVKLDTFKESLRIILIYYKDDCLKIQ